MAYRQTDENTIFDEMDNITTRITTRKMKANQEISRLTLGEIGNRVSAIKIDTTKSQHFKKEVSELTDAKLTFGRAAKTVSSTANVNADNKQVSSRKAFSRIVDAEVQSQAAVKLAFTALQLPGAPRNTGDVLLIDTISQNEAPIKLACTADRLQLPGAPRNTGGDVVLIDTISQNEAPMDVSGDGRDAFSKDLFAEQVEDIDIGDINNPQQVTVYVNDIYSFMRLLEKKYSIRPNLLQGTEITGKMRAILIDWLCRVHNKFHLLQETFYLTVAIIDRYLQVKPCRKSKLQLVGVTAMLVASKYEEMYAPEVADFVYITDRSYSKQDIRDMEHDILRTLDFTLGRPHCLHFLRRNSKAGQANASVHTLAKYLMELTVIEYDMTHLAPSLVAAAALYLSMLVHDGSSWSPTLQFYSSYSVDDIMPLVRKLAQLVIKTKTNKLNAVKIKYSSSVLMKIALIPQLQSKTLLDLASSQTSS